MPGKGKLIERDYTPAERKVIEGSAARVDLSTEEILEHLGERTCDVSLNELAYWRNIPVRVWDYTIGGYQVIKKGLSYREHKLLGRPLSTDEARQVMNIARRIASILLLEPSLDANYQAIKTATYPGIVAREINLPANLQVRKGAKRSAPPLNRIATQLCHAQHNCSNLSVGEEGQSTERPCSRSKSKATTPVTLTSKGVSSQMV